MTGKGTALVFGGSRGIGAAIAQRLPRYGFNVGPTYLSHPGSAHAVAT
jgi:3-oxoacyl-[acyl-carrier protein] reductase